MPMRTYAFCVLQTFHRLCKTSESVRPLEMREEGGEGVDKYTDRSVLQGNSCLPPISLEKLGTISKREPSRLCPVDSTHTYTHYKHA